MPDSYSPRIWFNASFAKELNCIVIKPKPTSVTQKIAATFNAIFLLMLTIHFEGIRQTKNVISTHRVFPKIDKSTKLEKAVANHAQKYHSGDSHLHAFAMQAACGYGGYSVYQELISIIALGDFTDKINIARVCLESGQNDYVVV